MRQLFFPSALVLLILLFFFPSLAFAQAAPTAQTGATFFQCGTTNVPKDWTDNQESCSVTVNDSSGPLKNATLKITSYPVYDPQTTKSTNAVTSITANGKTSYCTLSPYVFDPLTAKSAPTNYGIIKTIEFSAPNHVTQTIDMGSKQTDYVDDVCKKVGPTITLQGGVTTYAYVCTQDGTCQQQQNGTPAGDGQDLPVIQRDTDAKAKSDCASICGVWGKRPNQATADFACDNVSSTTQFKNLTQLQSGAGQNNDSLNGQWTDFYPTEQACKDGKYGIAFSSLRQDQNTPPTPSPTPTLPPPAPPCASKLADIDYSPYPTPGPGTPTPTPGGDPGTFIYHNFTQCDTVATGLGIFVPTDPQGFIQSIFAILLSLSGGIAILLIIRSGYQMMTAAGDSEKLKNAREILTSAIIGLLFLIFSLIILEVIGVDLLHIPGLSH